MTSMKTTELNELRDFAVSILVRSGRISRKYFRSNIQINTKSKDVFDPVTIADREVEAYLRNQIEKKYPDHTIFGEEYGHKEGNNVSWFIDPIDGTKGFISGSPMWGSLLGVTENKIPVMGVMHQPFIKETFFAAGKNACLKSGATIKKLQSSSTTSLDRAILYCTHPSMFGSKKEFKTFQKIESKVKSSRYGGDCYGYCLLASGHVDVVIESGLKPYDIIPLIPIIQAAGGVITDWKGNLPLKGGKVIAAANKKLHRQLMSIVSV